MKYLSGGNGSDLGTNSEAAMNDNHKKIDWDDYTYPPCGCVKMFHYLP
jgi:hypothetical protein